MAQMGLRAPGAIKVDAAAREALLGNSFHFIQKRNEK
jgi:hypothetical protein